MQRLRKGVEVMRFKVGDKVRVREDLKKRVVEMPSGFSIVITGEMIDLTDEVVTISSVGKETYKVEELKYYEWTDEMFEPIDDPLAQKILERNNKRSIQDRLPEELEKILAYEPHDPIKPSHYRKGEIDLYESWYRTYPFNEFRAGMQMIAERYMKRDKMTVSKILKRHVTHWND